MERTADTVLADLKRLVESKTPIDRREWLDAAFYLVVLRIEQARKFNSAFRAVASKRLDILKGQEKKNVAAANVEIQASIEYEDLKNQEDKLYSIDELIRVAKKSADEF